MLSCSSSARRTSALVIWSATTIVDDENQLEAARHRRRRHGAQRFTGSASASTQRSQSPLNSGEFAHRRHVAPAALALDAVGALDSTDDLRRSAAAGDACRARPATRRRASAARRGIRSAAAPASPGAASRTRADRFDLIVLSLPLLLERHVDLVAHARSAASHRSSSSSSCHCARSGGKTRQVHRRPRARPAGCATPRPS